MVQANIVVVGAGVSGLTTAVELKKSHPSYDITIVSSHLPGDISPDFTSPFAGANWHSFATIEDKRLQTYDLEGYKRLVQLAETDPKSGIWANDSYCFYSQSAVEEMGNKKPDPWYKHKVENYQTIPPEQLLPGTAHGYRFKGVVITVPIYLNYLLQKALEMGIAIKRVSALKEIGSARQLHSSGKRADVVVNCTGLLAKNIKGYRDPNRQYPVLGQVLHVRNNARTEFAVDGVDPSRPDESLYIFPRKEGGSIIGGCHRENFDSTDEDKEL
ncbi:nucleotide-binding domain-containing protein, partial [Yamadazyma tenuis ATCC 10573]